MGLIEFIKNKLIDEEEEIIEKEKVMEKPHIEDTKVVPTKKLPTILRDELLNEMDKPDASKSYKPPVKFNFENPKDEKIEPVKPAVEELMKEKKILEDAKPYNTKIEEKKETKVTTTYKSNYDNEKKFRPSKIISPVYGILDKNYRKEDITVKDEHSYEVPRRKDITYEDIRKKAYGTLSDEIERNLYQENKKIKNTIRDLDQLLNDLSKSRVNINASTIDKIETKIEESISNPQTNLKNLDIVKIIDHNNNGKENIITREERNSEDVYSLINQMYKEEE